MKILVAIKRVVDYNVKVRIKSDHSGVDLQHVKMSINPFCEIALEQAIQFKEQFGGEVVAVSIGPKESQETCRHALALGADSAIHIETAQNLQPLQIAQTLAKLASEDNYDLVLMGKQSIDGDNNQTPQMLAGLLDWPQATFASSVTLTDNKAVVVREVDGGLEHLELTLPAVISADLRLNTPRYATLPNIMKAKRKPLATRSIEEFELDLSEKIVVKSVMPPAVKQPGIRLGDVAELVDKLANEAKVI